MNLLLFLAVAIFFYWIYKTSGGIFTSMVKPFSLNDVVNSEFGYIIALVAKVAKSDGYVSDLEAELVSNVLDDLCDEFDDKEKAREFLKIIFNEEKELQENIGFVASEYYEKTRFDTYKHEKVLEFLVTLAFIDGTLHPREQDVIITVALSFHIPKSHVETLFSQFDQLYHQRKTTQNAKLTLLEAFALLNIGQDSTEAEIKKAYRREVRVHHPDIVSGKGGSEEDIKEATKKLQNINEAYELIRETKNF